MNLQLLQKYLGLTDLPIDSQINDVVFTAVDFEDIMNCFRKRGKCQAGIAILDTRDFVSQVQTPGISTFNFVVGPAPYYKCCNRRFLFGKTLKIENKDIRQNLEALISRRRNNILVGHGTGRDLKILKHLSFELESSIVDILDTQKLAAQMLPNPRARLCEILTDLQCPFQCLRNAGNDANFTMRPLLLLEIRTYYTKTSPLQDETYGIRRRSLTLQEISQSVLPRDTHQIAEERRRKKQKVLRVKELIRVARGEHSIAKRRRVDKRKRAEQKLKRQHMLGK